jgi:hypothetical protein
MSAMSQLKKKVGYETNVSRCEICRHFRKSKIVLTEHSNTKRVHHYCINHGFNVAANSICDAWTTIDGKIIEDANGIKGEA